MGLTAGDIYDHEAPVFMHFPSRRSCVHSTKGIVASVQNLANQAGLRILRQGGNAADAAVAVAATLNLTEPTSTGIGGDMFCLFYDAKTKKVHALNGSGRSPQNSTLDQVRKDINLAEGQDGRIPLDHVHSVTIPGAAAGWVDTVERFGSGKLSLADILAPTIELGEEGFPVSEIVSLSWKVGEGLLKRASPNFAEMLKKDPNADQGCRAPKAGEIMKNPTLANTFRLLAKHGKKGFYEGAVAEALVKATSDRGGYLTLDDLKYHMEMGSEPVDPVSLRLKTQGIGQRHDGEGVDVWEHPPNGQGIVALMALGILQELEKDGKIKKFTKEDHNSVEYLHAVIEALRIAFADGTWWIADPNVSKGPIKEMITDSYLRERSKLFDSGKANLSLGHGSPAMNSSDTVYFSVADSEGNGISFINSNFTGFGASIIPKGCGFTLQNRGTNFSLQKGHPNVFAPRKRPYHTIIPALVTNAVDQSLHTVFGVMGGFMQPQGHVQVLMNMLTFKMNPQTALDAPRICIGGHDEVDSTVSLEEGISEEVGEKLRQMGHNVLYVKDRRRSQFGRGQIIRVHKEDDKLVYSAGSDLRGDGAAVPL